jgi:hypothetical protein
MTNFLDKEGLQHFYTTKVIGRKQNAGEVFNDYENNIAEAYGFRLIDVVRNSDGTGTFKIARTPSAEKAWTKLILLPNGGDGLTYSAHVAMQIAPAHSDGYISKINTFKVHDSGEDYNYDQEYWGGGAGRMVLYVKSQYISDEPLMTFVYNVGKNPETLEGNYDFSYNGNNYTLHIKATETNYVEYSYHDCLGGCDETPTLQLEYEVHLYSYSGLIDPNIFDKPLVNLTFDGQQFDCYGIGVSEVYINDTTTSSNSSGQPEVKSAQVENFGKITNLAATDDYYLIEVDKGFSDAPNNFFTGNNFYAYDEYEEYSDLNTIHFIEQPLVGDILISKMAHAEGGNNKALNKYAHAEGYENNSYGAYAHTEGRKNKAGYAAHASGYGNEASGQASFATGYETRSKSFRTFTQGLRTSATAKQAIATGESTSAAGENSLALGKETQAIGNRSVASGKGSIAKADDSKASGFETQTDNLEANLKYPSGASAEGYQTKAFGSYGSHAEGREAQALGQTSHAQGFRTTAAARWQDVSGTLNLVDNRHWADSINNGGYAQIIGNGYQLKGLEGRSNAYALDWNGNGFYAQNLFVNTTFTDNGDETFSVSGDRVATQNEVAVSIKNVNSSIDKLKTDVNNTISSLITRDSTGKLTLVGNGAKAYSLQYGNNIDDKHTIEATEMGSIAFGAATKATNYWAMAIGSYSEANGNASFAAGNKAITSTNVKGQVVLGNNNVVDNDAQFIVGCNTKNGLTVTTDGRLKSSSFEGKEGCFVTIGEDGELIATTIQMNGVY